MLRLIKEVKAKLTKVVSRTNADIFLNNIKVACVLTHFSPVSYFYTPWKRQKTKDFPTFSGGKEMWHWTKMG